MRITDDVRILVALRDGGSAQNYYKSGYGWSTRRDIGVRSTAPATTSAVGW